MAWTTSSDLAEEMCEDTKGIMKLLSEFINCTLFPEWMGSHYVPQTKIRNRSCWTHILGPLQTMNMPTHVISWRTTFWRRWNTLRWVTSWPDSVDKVSLRLAGRYFPVAQELEPSEFSWLYTHPSNLPIHLWPVPAGFKSTLNIPNIISYPPIYS